MSTTQQEEIVEKRDDIIQMEVEEKGAVQMPAEEVERLADMLDQARKATESEHKMTLLQAVRRYPKASAWSIAISFGVVMEGQYHRNGVIARTVTDFIALLYRLRRGPLGQLLCVP